MAGCPNATDGKKRMASTPPPTLYEDLGVPRTADTTAIRRAYEGLVREFQKDTTAPDPRREARIREAYQVLTNPARRDEYDRSLVVVVKKKFGKGAIAVIAGLVAVMLGAVVVFNRPPAKPHEAPARTAESILSGTHGSVGRVEAIDMSGTTREMGLAVQFEKGTLVASCQGLPSGAQLVVHIAPRSLPARVSMAEEKLGLCKIIAERISGEPLRFTGLAPQVGEAVHAVGLNAKGEVALAAGTLLRAGVEGDVKVYDASVKPQAAGAALLNRQGEIVAVALVRPDGAVRFTAVPAGWLVAKPQPDAAPAKPVEAPATPAPGTGDPTKQPSEFTDPRAEKGRQALEKMTPEQRERFEKAFKPPDAVKDL